MTQDAHAGHGDCSEVLHRIYEYLDGEMSADDVRRVAAHLNECQPCLAEHDLDVALKQVVRRSCSARPRPWRCGCRSCSASRWCAWTTEG